MTAEELLRQARARGADFQVLESGRINVQAPSPLPDALMEELRQHKAAILDLLVAPNPECDDSTAALLAWAAQAAEAGLTLSSPVHFLETPLRPCTTTDVGRYCREQLKFLSLARSNKATGGWGQFTPEWWNRMGEEAIEALAALKAAANELDAKEKQPDDSSSSNSGGTPAHS